MSTETFRVFPVVTERAAEHKAEVRAPSALPTTPSCPSDMKCWKYQTSLPRIYSKITPAYWHCKEGLGTATPLGIEQSVLLSHTATSR